MLIDLIKLERILYEENSVINPEDVPKLMEVIKTEASKNVVFDKGKEAALQKLFEKITKRFPAILDGYADNDELINFIKKELKLND